MQWLNTQSNLMDSLRYLVENEIALNGVRNLQAFVPMERSRLQSSNSPVIPQENEARPQASAGLEQMAASKEEAPAAPVVPAAEPAVEEEFDDDDIEAWS